MEKFREMKVEDVIGIINKSMELREILDCYVQQSEMDFIGEKISEFSKSAIEYSISPFERSYLYPTDNDAFLEGVEKSGKSYGLGNRTEKYLSICKKVKGTNFYGWWVKKLCASYYSEEIEPALKWIEDCSYELYHGNVGEKSRDYVDMLIESTIGDYLWDKETETYYIPKKVA